MRALLLILALTGCANVNASAPAAHVSNPSCWVLCFDRNVPVDQSAPTPR